MSTDDRLHALDAVRAGALLGGVVLHATLSFLPGMQGWAYADSHPSAFLGGVFFALHTFRMTAFFLIAGFFAHMSFHRKGLRGFALDRLKRIGVPMVAAWPLLFAAIMALWIWGGIAATGAPPRPPPAPPGGGPLLAFPLLHLWFLYVLMLLYAATLAVRGLVALADRSGRLRQGLDVLVRAVLGSVVAPLLLAAPLTATLFLSPRWMFWLGIPTPDHSLIPSPAAAVAFTVAFSAGWLLHRQPDLLQVWKGRWIPNLIAALVLTAVCLVTSQTVTAGHPPAAGWEKLAHAGLYALTGWVCVLAVIGLALRFLSGHAPAIRYLADASYWIYLVHLPLVVALQILVGPLDLPWPVKFVAIVATAMGLMLGSYQLFVRYGFIGAVLNGRRRRPERPAREGRAVSPAAPPATV